MEAIEETLDALPEDGERDITDDVEDEARRARLKKEKAEVIAEVAAGNFSTVRAKVAWILNLHQSTRNSDVTLSLKYWETFQPELFNEGLIHARDLFKLERTTLIARYRAKIQNEYGLYQADAKIRNRRRKNEEAMEAEVIADQAPQPVMWVYADETGKTARYVIVAAVWVLSGGSVYKVSKAIDEWKAKSPWAKREVHFSRFGRQDVDTLREYLGVVLANREFLSFKAIAVEKAKTKRSIEEVVALLHRHMLERGAFHEVDTQRVSLPRKVSAAVDEEQSLDQFALSDLKKQVNIEYKRVHGDKLVLTDIVSVSSKSNPLVQLADLCAGALNRRLNSEQPERGAKDEMADMVIEMLDLNLNEGAVDGLDAAAMFIV
ncbi:DUF3800 domain-containing protein [Pandoraea sputorum]|uniref:Protein of uncharacterized function (DUF3800) n=1 Tax=Pandoraea sputorum TaxID=93222 RepID=A0A239SVT0_9BURK|nr:DUF3800 domain-containing protein [Pandoraea sputorum]AJC18491.2 hypothetical protein NA29_02225 [Pandoraea sputorum]SNU89591.1 Protein of uncharacterised function (DUF3800) [Pandoraea sputorum]